MREKIILGIDPGYDRCGVAVVTGTAQKPKVLFSCCIETSKTQKFHERILFIFKCLSDIIEEQKPTHCSIEDIFLAKNAKTAVKVSEARGVCLLAAAYFKLEIAEYTPLQIKTYLTSYGKADKKQIHFIVRKILERSQPEYLTAEKRLDDEIDAVAIALTHLFVSR